MHIKEVLIRHGLAYREEGDRLIIDRTYYLTGNNITDISNTTFNKKIFLSNNSIRNLNGVIIGSDARSIFLTSNPAMSASRKYTYLFTNARDNLLQIYELNT